MTEKSDKGEWTPSSRGDAAWKETMERVASRNVEARKQGRIRREAYEQERADARRATAAKQRAQLLNRRAP
jgi:hypothetical protein